MTESKPNQALNPTQNRYAVLSPPLRSGAG